MDEKTIAKPNRMIWMDKGWQKEIWKKLLAFSLILIVGYLYFLSNHYNDARFVEFKPTIFTFPIDQWIPFNRFFIIPYFYWYFYIAITVLLMFFQKDSKNFYRLIFSMSSGIFISSIIFVVFPTYVPRPTLVGNDFLTGLVQQIYTIDPPYNCFPSMHVLYAFVCGWYLTVFKRVSWWFDVLNAVSFVLICMSTVYTKQHYTPDIAGGIVLGAAACCFFTFSKIVNKKNTGKIPS
jgi:membrane-associated phospholipid phosphatase